jgi:glycosyltransferase involved in cell wall biosynthesis
LALAALAEGKTLLAADSPWNRNVTPRGSGCLWFEPGHSADLARRLLFLASDRAFCDSLASSGSRYLRQTRNPARIVEQYDAVYRHAWARRRSGSSTTPALRWEPSQACI